VARCAALLFGMAKYNPIRPWIGNWSNQNHGSYYHVPVFIFHLMEFSCGIMVRRVFQMQKKTDQGEKFRGFKGQLIIIVGLGKKNHELAFRRQMISIKKGVCFNFDISSKTVKH
jgi:hypothetical protein